jgi:hypothetical protein
MGSQIKRILFLILVPTLQCGVVHPQSGSSPDLEVQRLVEKLVHPGKPDPVARQHIQAIISTLPPDSSLRRTLEAGRYGTGIHEPWMDHMKLEGVELVIIRLRGVWHKSTRFEAGAMQSIIYCKAYEGPGSQFSTPVHCPNSRRVALRVSSRRLHLSDPRTPSA